VDRCLNLENHIARLAAMPDVAVGPQQPTPPAGKPIRLLLSDGTVRVLELEEYLRGVVGAEMPDTWPLEALKTQAVAARSFAMAAIAHPRHLPNADICATTHCQAYNEARGNANCDLAVRQTASQVIVYEGQLATAYYSANCGGHTLGNETAFGGPPLPYLRPVTCINPGPKNGHAVGMCQWGAHDMAQRGDNYATILKHYYTGIRLSGEPQQPSPPTANSGEIGGRVTDAAGRAATEIRLRLSGGGWTGEAITGPDGSYRFTHLPPGTYNLIVVDHDLRRDGLTLAAGQQLVIDLKLPSSAPSQPTTWTMQIERRSGLPVLAGSLPHGGLEVTLQTPVGATLKRKSGSKPQYGVGGFEFWAPNRGLYKLSFLDQMFELTLEGTFTLVTFSEGQETAAKGAIQGVLRDQAGAPVAGREITLSGTGVSRSTTTGTDGTFEFAGLAAGDYTLKVAGADLSRTVKCDGSSPAALLLTLPAVPASQPQQGGWIMKVTRTAGPAYIAGTLPQAGVALTITPPSGQPIRLLSGSKPNLGTGGFQVPAITRGTYTIQFLDQTFELPVDAQYTFVVFTRGVGATQTETRARLVSEPMLLSQAEGLLQRLEANPTMRGFFKVDDA
jgi:hypothetical protein